MESLYSYLVVPEMLAQFGMLEFKEPWRASWPIPSRQTKTRSPESSVVLLESSNQGSLVELQDQCSPLHQGTVLTDTRASSGSYNMPRHTSIRDLSQRPRPPASVLGSSQGPALPVRDGEEQGPMPWTSGSWSGRMLGLWQRLCWRFYICVQILKTLIRLT